MGSKPGPIPKRASERRRRNKDTGTVDTVVVAGSVPAAPPCPTGLHPQARRWYKSLALSGQAKFYQASDWERARMLAILWSKVLHSERPSSEMVKALISAEAELGTTEGSRRRMRIEIERAVNVDPAKVTAMDAYRAAREG